MILISFVITQGRAQGQFSSEDQTLLPFSTAPHEGFEDSPSVRSAPSDQVSTTPCRLRVPDTIHGPTDNRAPAASESAVYTPSSTHCKFSIFLKSTYSPYTFLSASFQATLDQAQGQWRHYGGGMQGWGKRFGATLADTESRRFIQTFALSTIFHQDPRYFPSYRRNVISRAWYAVTRAAITRNDSGNDTFNTSEFLGALFASSLQNSYYPRHDRSFGETMSRFGNAVSSDALGNLLLEFTPDMKLLFRKHAPEKIQSIEEKLPIPEEDKP